LLSEGVKRVGRGLGKEKYIRRNLPRGAETCEHPEAGGGKPMELIIGDEMSLKHQATTDMGRGTSETFKVVSQKKRVSGEDFGCVGCRKSLSSIGGRESQRSLTKSTTPNGQST